MKIRTLFFLLLFIHNFIVAQKQSKLFEELKIYNADSSSATTKQNSALRIIKSSEFGIEEKQKIIISHIEYLHKIKNDKLLGKFYGIILYKKVGLSITESYKHLKKGIDFSKKHDLSYSLVKANQALKNLQFDVGDTIGYIVSLLETEKALDNVDSSFTKLRLQFYKKSGYQLYNINKIDKSLEILQKGLAYDQKDGRINVHEFFMWLGINYASLNKKDSSIYYQKKFIEYYKGMDNKSRLAEGYRYLSYAYSNAKEYDTALYYLDKSYKLFIEIGKPKRAGLMLSYQAKILEKKEMYISAAKLYNEIFDKFINILSNYTKLDIYLQASIIYSKLGNKSMAFETLKKYIQIRDEVEKADKLKELERAINVGELNSIRHKSEVNRRIFMIEQQAKDQKVALNIKIRNITILSSIIVFIAMALIVLMIYRNLRNTRKQKDEIEKQKRKISQKNEELNQLVEEVTSQKDEIENQNKKIHTSLQELENTQEQLVESKKMASLGNLVAGVAHEINTPVGNGISASSSLINKAQDFSELYKSKKMKKSELEAFINSTLKAGNLIFANLKRTGKLVQNFKQVSVNQAAEDIQEFNLKSYINNVIASLEPKLQEKPVDIKISCPENIIVNSFQDAFAQIITNFITNSLIHGFKENDSGQIEIRATENKGLLTIEYLDNGQGISEDIISKVFDPFFTTNKQLGSGLGLHIVYNLLIQKLNGSVHLESKLEKGVHFTIQTPLVLSQKNDQALKLKHSEK
ncbi:MAG: HAMP domain-containing histidine kinase [Bacteroidetes bacterium]|jgi:signal transduction histidine kinase|nr:HAMP domain-containing histidine kinase [Bacteroidota bacterium]MBT6685142.1 HAMP domain-containing histidine kinase [Bacteroidota bacterium]MBT7142053.1 HAMP domain-containing histidine kinase [Bacteroidota bacterium]MBT7493375.1 HAMP domain-containing histidine kinase [Bacteroidota bacterium]